jgi:hypothetical protein
MEIAKLINLCKIKDVGYGKNAFPLLKDPNFGWVDEILSILNVDG